MNSIYISKVVLTNSSNAIGYGADRKIGIKDNSMVIRRIELTFSEVEMTERGTSRMEGILNMFSLGCLTSK